MYWPTFNSEFLQGFVKAQKKRSKSLKHKSWGFKCERVLEQGPDGKEEKLEFEIKGFGEERDRTFRLLIWEDRWTWVDVRESANKGWKFEWEAEGRLLGDVDPRRIVEALEETLLTREKEKLQGIWSPFLATGPKSIR